MPTWRLSSFLVFVAWLGACGGSSEKAAAPSRPALEVPAPKTGESEETPPPPARGERAGEPGPGAPDDAERDVHIELHRDGGTVWAKTVSDGGFSFSFSVSVSVDGSSVNVTIHPDAGAP